MSLPEVGVKNFNVIQDRNQWKKKNGWTEHNRITLQLVPFYRSCYRLLCDRPSKREEDKCTKKTHRDIQEQRKHKEVYQRDKNKIGRKHTKKNGLWFPLRMLGCFVFYNNIYWTPFYSLDFDPPPPRSCFWQKRWRRREKREQIREYKI